ncbi:MAG: endonuclease/exonuclease/phosphatase family protein [Myxococcota bacterium]
MRRDGLLTKSLLAAGLLVMLWGTRAFHPEGAHVSLAPAIDLAGEGWPMRVLSWNIGQAYDGGESRAPAGILEHVAQVIEMEQPLVVALQELRGRDQMETLVTRLEGGYQGYLAEGGDADRHTGILVRNLEGGGGREFRAVQTGAGRDAAAAIFRLPRSQIRICAISVHADAWDPDARARYTRKLVDWGRRQKYDVVFLAGDLNLEAGTEAGGEALFTRSQETDSASYEYVTRHFRDLGLHGGDTALPGRRIDYVFARGRQLKVKRVAVLKGHRAGRMDHRPLVVDALIPKPMILTRR